MNALTQHGAGEGRHEVMSQAEGLTHSTLLMDFLAQAGITPRLLQPSTTEVIVNRPKEIWTYSADHPYGRYEDAPWLTLDLCRKVANALAAFNQQRLDVQHPIHTLKFPDSFPDGVRAQVVISPACEKDTVAMCMRMPSETRLSLQDYISSGRLDQVKAVSQPRADLLDWEKQLVKAHQAHDWMVFFRLAVLHKLNIIIFGGPGSGKTTLGKALVDMFPHDRRMITVEAVNEMVLPHHRNRVHLTYGQHVSPKQLVASTMRMKPDHLFLAELTGDEAWHYMEILNTGVPGTVTTAHANDTVSGYARVCGLVKQSEVGKGLDYAYIDRLVRSSFDVVIYMEHTHVKEVHYDPIYKLNLINQLAA